MKLHILSLVSVLALSGCTTTDGVVEINKSAPPVAASPIPKPKPSFTPTAPVVVILDPGCANIAKSASRIAILRDAGINEKDAFVLVEVGGDYPISPIIREVYSRKDITPEAGGTNAYNTCIKTGFENMSRALWEAQSNHRAAEIKRAQEEQAARKKKK